MLLPRIFAGTMLINPVGTNAGGEGEGLIPLGPVSGNFTQSVYLISDLVCFLVIRSLSESRSTFRFLLSSLLLASAMNVLFAILDVSTYWTGTEHYLDFIRNAPYTLHIDEQVSGSKRIVGSFTEASTFSSVTLSFFGVL